MDFEEIKKLKSVASVKQKPKFKINPFSYMFPSMDNDQYLQFGYRKLNSFYRFIFTVCETSVTLLIRFVVLWFFSSIYISKASIDVISKHMQYTPTKEGLNGKIDLQFFSQYIYWLNQDGHLVITIIMLVISFFAGSLYHILMPIRANRSTPVGQILKFVIVDKNTFQKMTLKQSTARYFCALLPILIAILFSKYILGTLYYKMLLMSTVVAYFFWFDIAPNTLFIGQSISDKICGTIILRKVKR